MSLSHKPKLRAMPTQIVHRSHIRQKSLMNILSPNKRVKKRRKRMPLNKGYADPFVTLNLIEKVDAKRNYRKPKLLKLKSKQKELKAVNATAALYQNIVPLTAPNCFINLYEKRLFLKIALFKPFENIRHFSLQQHLHQLCESECWLFIHKYIGITCTDDPFADITDDRTLYRLLRDGQITTDSHTIHNPHIRYGSYRHIDHRVASNVNAVREFRKGIQVRTGGTKDDRRRAMQISLYQSINGVSAIWKGDFVAKQCIDCNMVMDAVPLFCIGKAQLFVSDQPTAQSHEVYLYIVAVLCSNYPCCVFPICRKSYSTNWIKIAWFNDINGKEFSAKLDCDINCSVTK